MIDIEYRKTVAPDRTAYKNIVEELFCSSGTLDFMQDVLKKLWQTLSGHASSHIPASVKLGAIPELHLVKVFSSVFNITIPILVIYLFKALPFRSVFVNSFARMPLAYSLKRPRKPG